MRQYPRELTLFCTKFELSKTIWAIPMYLIQADVAHTGRPEPKGVGWGHVHSSPDGHLSPHKLELSRTIFAIPMYLHRKMFPFPVALNPKELVEDISTAVLMATFPHIPGLSCLEPFGPSPCTCRGILPYALKRGTSVKS